MLSLILTAVWTLGLATPPTVTMMPTVLPIPGDVAAVDRATLVREGIIINDFDPPAQRWQAGHRGIDLRASDATELYAPSSGTVTFAGVVAGKNVVVLQHDNGLRSSFEPVTTQLPVGTFVEKGRIFAHRLPDAVSHCSGEGCIHWGVRDGDTYVDPLTLINPWVRVRLLE